MGIVELIQDAAGTVFPREQGLFQTVVADALISLLQIELQALCPGVGHPYGGIVAGHRRPVAPDDGKGGDVAALAVHLYVGIELILLHFRIENGLQRLQGDMRVPHPVIRIEGTVALVDLMIEGTVVAAVFIDVDHALIAAVQGGVEQPPLVLSPAFDLDFAESGQPGLLRLLADGVEVPAGDLLLQVGARRSCVNV